MKKVITRIVFFICLFVGVNLNLSAQLGEEGVSLIDQIDTTNANFARPAYLRVSKKDIMDRIDQEPSFGIYHDNYFTTGIPSNKGITRHTADAKYQVSIRQRLTKTVLPFDTYLMVTYTQKSFWNIYESSSPFADNNYNPGLLLGKPIVSKNQLKGLMSLAVEHESNGMDGDKSRSWNYFVLSGVYYYNFNFSVQAKLWAGWIDEENADLLTYRGYGLLAINYRGVKNKLWFSVILNPRDGGLNTTFEINYRPFRKSNQYLFLQWYDGYGEGLLEYNKYSSMIRMGICIKPPLRNYF